jgi:putative DNA primase/helicase
VTIKEVDKSLRDALRKELPGILQWIIDGCKEWQEKELSPPSTVRAETESYLDQEDTFGQWVSACLQRVERAFTSRADLFASWAQFAKDAGEEPGSQKSFAAEMIAHEFRPKRTNTSRGYLDVILKSDDMS